MSARCDRLTLSPFLTILSCMRYNGGKAQAGLYQKLINLIPPHETYIETHLGGGAVMRFKRSARRSIGIEIDPEVVACWQATKPKFELLKGDALEFLQTYAFEGSEFVYSDPPYVRSSRQSTRDIYRFEYTDDDHRRLLACLRALPCKVMISGYWSPLYVETLSDWQSFSFESRNRRNDVATEWVWMNYLNPVALHDYRYLGKDYRERERIKRKKERWVAKLQAMPPLEQQALLSAISEVLPVKE